MLARAAHAVHSGARWLYAVRDVDRMWFGVCVRGGVVLANADVAEEVSEEELRFQWYKGGEPIDECVLDAVMVGAPVPVEDLTRFSVMYWLPNHDAPRSATVVIRGFCGALWCPPRGSILSASLRALSSTLSSISVVCCDVRGCVIRCCGVLCCAALLFGFRLQRRPCCSRQTQRTRSRR